MTLKPGKFVARLRREQPALSILPGLLLGQIITVKLNPLLAILIITLSVFWITRCSKFLGFSCGLALGLLSALDFSGAGANQLTQESHVIAQISNQPFRYPKHGLMIFKLKILALQDLKTEKETDQIVNRTFLCKAVNLPWRNVAKIKPGQYIALKGRFNLFPDKLWPWEYEAALKRRAIDGQCKVIYLAGFQESKRSFFMNLKTRLLERYKLTVGGDEIAALLLSLSIGIRDQISSSTEREFKDLGISHVLVLSGMQIGLLFFSLAWLLRKLIFFVHCSAEIKPLLLFSVVAPVSLSLVAITDFEASALRAWIACMLVSVANINERITGIFRGSLASLVLLSLIWPGCWAEAGVQLSFAALSGIAFGQVLAQSKLQKVLLPCMLATIFSSIVAACWFEQYSFSGLIANVFLAPLLGVFGCYLGLAAIFFSLFSNFISEEMIMLIRYITQNILQMFGFFQKNLPGLCDLSWSQTAALFAAGSCLLVFCIYKKSELWIRELNLFLNYKSAD